MRAAGVCGPRKTALQRGRERGLKGEYAPGTIKGLTSGHLWTSLGRPRITVFSALGGRDGSAATQRQVTVWGAWLL